MKVWALRIYTLLAIYFKFLVQTVNAQGVATLHRLSNGKVRTELGSRLSRFLRDKVSAVEIGLSEGKETLARSLSFTDTSFPTLTRWCRTCVHYVQNIYKTGKRHGSPGRCLLVGDLLQGLLLLVTPASNLTPAQIRDGGNVSNSFIMTAKVDENAYKGSHPHSNNLKLKSFCEIIS